MTPATSSSSSVKPFCSKCKIQTYSHYTHQHDDWLKLFEEDEETK